eukprot:scaffold13900_cov93-Isochrysis_galbana.AAC.2
MRGRVKGWRQRAGGAERCVNLGRMCGASGAKNGFRLVHKSPEADGGVVRTVELQELREVVRFIAVVVPHLRRQKPRRQHGPPPRAWVDGSAADRDEPLHVGQPDD